MARTMKAEPFTVRIPKTELGELRRLISCGKISAPTYESLQEDRRFGITHKWLEAARQAWLEFDWYVEIARALAVGRH